MSFWNKIDPWLDRKKLAFTTLAIFTGCLTLFTTIKKERVDSAEDLVDLEGKLSSYSFKNGSRGSKLYHLRMEGYPCTFKIPADYLPCFSKSEFVNRNLEQETVKFKISKKGNNKILLNGESVFVYGIYANDQYFLNENCAIKVGRISFPYSIAFSFLFIAAGAGFYFYKQKRLKSKQI